jgi:hypothetical protein
MFNAVQQLSSAVTSKQGCRQTTQFRKPHYLIRHHSHHQPPYHADFYPILQMSRFANLHSDEMEMRPVDAIPDTGQGTQNDHPNWFQRARYGVVNLIQRMDNGVAKSRAGRLFRLKGSGHVRITLEARPWQKKQKLT